MPETFKQNVTNWAVAASVLALGGVSAWVLQISVELTDLKSYAKETERVRSSVSDVSGNLQTALEQVKDQMRDIEVALTDIGNLRDLMEKMEYRINQIVQWRSDSGLKLAELETKLDATIKTLSYVEEEIKVGKRYTREMADGDKRQVYMNIDRLQKQLDELARTMGVNGNSIQTEMQGLRETFNAILMQSLNHPGGRWTPNAGE